MGLEVITLIQFARCNV